MKKHPALIVFLLLFVGCSGNHSNASFLRRQVVIGSNAYKYRVYVPPKHRPDEKLPVMLFLHGSDERGDDNEAQIRGLDKVIEGNPQNFPFIIVFPQCRKNTFWAGEMTAQAVRALDETVREFSGDENRLYLAGFSLGGYGVWQTAVMYPDKFAALVPMSGRVMPRLDKNSKETDVLSPEQLAVAVSPEPYKAMAEKIGRKPVWVFHGKEDNIVPIGQSRKITEALRNLGDSKVNVTEYENTGHYTQEKVFNEPQLFAWLTKQTLEKST